MSDTPIKSLTLQDPIKYGEGETISKLDFRDINGSDLEDFPLQGATLGDYMKIAARISEQTPSVLRRASGRDTFAIAGAVESQLASGPLSGET